MNVYADHTDEQLVASLVQGDEKAFEAIYFRYVKRLTAYARRRISSIEDCEELIQEVFASLWARHDKLGHVRPLEPYLFRMVKYKVIRYYEHHQVVQKYADHFRAFEMMVEDVAEENELENLRAVIQTTIEELPERCQEAIRLRLDENLSNGDIAMRMNIDKSTVKRYITTALSYLREKHAPLYNRIVDSI